MDKKIPMNNFEIIKNRLEELEVSNSDFGYSHFVTDDEILGDWKEVEQEGGEGQGEEWYSVKHFKKYDVYIRIDGYYASYDGTTFDDDYYEVKPKEKKIVVYEAV